MIEAMKRQTAQTPFITSTAQKQAEKNTGAEQTQTNQLQQNGDEALSVNGEVTKEKVKKAVEQLNQFLSGSSTHLKFQFHDRLKEYYVTIVDDQSNRVIKEIPPKRILDTYADMMRNIGFLIDEKI
ncbi:hypothetical protein BpJC7_00890 [Weizmannia acidilactici]|uniref:Flagellar protein FlaG n=2 Tax=Heyndrickxia TaxID=2837504 RepID=A0A5J4J1I1_9BACI|nr:MULTISPECIES: flagellar protein FlaG [Heyndrickxia]MDL5040070.1 flagellar protein FlaG [Heyndrickxia coagulans]GER66000.1 hypothetical protein BpJC4_04710 [Weizmannia acidilactici]GER68786.1 hypothetical protein BpJC7_00890 [Weizmannia acidilactici]GER72929.1 hypothetical protein BpPP18_09960 [Weizmannia acidilactici]